jgi:hypothetical protein
VAALEHAAGHRAVAAASDAKNGARDGDVGNGAEPCWLQRGMPGVLSASAREVPFLEAARHYSGRNEMPPYRRAKTSFVHKPLDGAGIQALVTHAANMPPPPPGEPCATPNFVWLQALGGAVARGPKGPCGGGPGATAFAHRAALYWIEWGGAWGTPDARAPIDRWIEGAYNALAPHIDAGQGAGQPSPYVNFPDMALGDGRQALRAFYGPPERLARLQTIKSRYDPEWVLASPQGVPPKGCRTIADRVAHRARSGLLAIEPGLCCEACAASIERGIAVEPACGEPAIASAH